MKKTVALTLLLYICMAAAAQNTVESVRKAYQDVHEVIGMMSDDFPGDGIPPEYYDLHVEQNLPATGPHHEHIRMYYGELESEEDNPYPPHYLWFATAKYNFAMREHYEEYLYDDKGQVMFIYALTPDVDDSMKPYELRLWFDGDRLLRFTAKQVEDELDYLDLDSVRKASFKEVFSGDSIPEKYEWEADRCLSRAWRFLTMFKGIDDNTYN